MIDDKLEKKIKKNIYGQHQKIKIIYPPGFSSVALDEIQSILDNPWFASKGTNNISLLTNEIRIHDIHMFSIVELLIRNQCLSDIRLIIFEGKAYGKNIFEQKCRSIPWEFYLNKNMSVKIIVKSIASKAFHESGLKNILSDILKENKIEVVKGEDQHATTCIDVDLYKDRLTLSISLAGNPLYKRGYRGVLSASAPLREDAASCCIRKAMRYVASVNESYSPNTIFIPFSGTGTFAFEFIQFYFHFLPGLLGREYALQKMPLFRRENFNYLLKKAKEHCLLPKTIADGHLNDIQFVCIDNSQNANSALIENLAIFNRAVIQNDFSLPKNLFVEENQNPFLSNNFFEMEIDKIILPSNKMGNIFILLNPPYGIRLGKHSNPVPFYKNIAKKVNEIARITQMEKKKVLGFILCPSEETWSSFCKALLHSQTETYHFTQGGRDIRVCQFVI